MTDPNLEQTIADHLIVVFFPSRLDGGVAMEWYVKCHCEWAEYAPTHAEAEQKFADHVVAAIRDSGYTVIATPTIDHLGPDRTVADMYAGAAWKLDNGYEPGGSNVKASIARTLRAIAAQHAGDTQ